MMSLFAREPRTKTKAKRRTSVPTDPEGWLREAEIAEDTGEWKRALGCYRNALKLAPFCTTTKLCYEDTLEAALRAAGVEDGVPEEFLDEDPLDWASGLRDRIRTEAGRVASRRPKRVGGVSMSWLRPSGPMVFWSGAACLALFLSFGLLFMATKASAVVRDLLANTSLPELSSLTASLPSGLLESIADANEMLAAGNFAEAVEKLEDLRTEHPTHTGEINVALGQAYRALGAHERRNQRPDRAADAYRGAADAVPDNIMNWVDLGNSLRDHARESNGSTEEARQIFSQAERAYQQALEIDETDTSALYGLAQVFAAQNNRSRAIYTYEKLVEHAPDSFEGRMAERALEQLRRR